MEDASCRIDQEHAGGKRVQTVGERSRLDGLSINHLTDQNGAANMRGDERKSPAHFVVRETVAHGADGKECIA